jgi:flagellar basal body-associated protein FliL
MPHISLRFKKLKVKLIDSAQVAWIHAKNFTYYVAVDGRKIAVEKIKVQLKIFAESLAKNKANFKKLSWKLKLAFVGIFVLILLTPALIYLSVTNRLVPSEPELFLNSIESVAGEKSEYDAAEGMEGFYDNLRASQNMILIQKMVLNIKTSKSSGPNPMVAMEFFVEGVNSDVVVEIKDREVMMRDLMMRTIEDFDFDTLESGDGKKELVARLQKELNAVLTTGRIKNIRIKTFIVKP